MITFEDAERANDFIRDNAIKYALSVSHREQLDEYLKITEATLMNEQEGPEHLKKAYARSHERYLINVDGRREAREGEIELKWLMVAAQAKIDMWRSYNKTHSMGA